MLTITGVSPEDVYDITGVNVDAATVAQAKSMIEIFLSVELDNFSGFRAANRTWIQKAICYQAAWIPSQAGLFSRMDFQSVTQDGLTFTPREEYATLIAPLAKKSLSRVSWARTRTALVAPGRQTRLANRINAGNDTREGGNLNRYPGQPVTDADFDNWTGTDTWI